MAEITSQEEQDVLDLILPTITNWYHWIGLNDLASPGNFKWQNSYAPATFTNWRSDHPKRNSACVMLTEGVHMRLKIGEPSKSQILMKLGWFNPSMG